MVQISPQNYDEALFYHCHMFLYTNIINNSYLNRNMFFSEMRLKDTNNILFVVKTRRQIEIDQMRLYRYPPTKETFYNT